MRIACNKQKYAYGVGTTVLINVDLTAIRYIYYSKYYRISYVAPSILPVSSLYVLPALLSQIYHIRIILHYVSIKLYSSCYLLP